MVVLKASDSLLSLPPAIPPFPFPFPFPLPPPAGEVLGILLVGVQVFSSAFNIFLNIGRANWDVVIKSAMGIFPQFSEVSNTLTVQLVSLNKFLKYLNSFSLGVINNSDIIIPILKPVVDNPLSFLNPMKLKDYTMNIMMTIVNKMLS